MIETKILAQFDRELKKGFAPKLQINLNQKEVELILLIRKFPTESMGYYGREIGLEKGSFTYLSELLTQKELILPKENPRDSRSKLLELTERGRIIADDIRDQFDYYIKERLSVFSEYELHQLKFAVEVVFNLFDRIQHSKCTEDK